MPALFIPRLTKKILRITKHCNLRKSFEYFKHTEQYPGRGSKDRKFARSYFSFPQLDPRNPTEWFVTVRGIPAINQMLEREGKKKKKIAARRCS